MALHPKFPTSPYAPLIPEQRWFPADEALRSTAYEKLLPPLVANVREEVFAWRNRGYAGASATSVALLRHWFDTEHLTENADGSLSTLRYYFAQREAVETVIWLYEVRGARDKYDLLRFDASGAVSSGMFAEDWPRYVVKMATGAGKTKVLSLLIAWSFFHKLYEADSALSRNFLVVAPNIIVLDRLRADFVVRTRDGKIWIAETKGRAELDLPRKMARLKQWCADATAAENADGGSPGQQYDFVFVDQNPFEKWFQSQGPKSFAALATSFNDYKG